MYWLCVFRWPPATHPMKYLLQSVLLQAGKAYLKLHPQAIKNVFGHFRSVIFNIRSGRNIGVKQFFNYSVRVVQNVRAYLISIFHLEVFEMWSVGNFQPLNRWWSESVELFIFKTVLGGWSRMCVKSHHNPVIQWAKKSHAEILVGNIIRELKLNRFRKIYIYINIYW